MSEQSKSNPPVTYSIPTRLPQFVESAENTSYANVVNVAIDGGDCCLTFLRKPRPMAVDVDAVKAGDFHLEMSPVSRVYLPVEVARALCQMLGQNLIALDAARPRPGQTGGSN